MHCGYIDDCQPQIHNTLSIHIEYLAWNMLMFIYPYVARKEKVNNQVILQNFTYVIECLGGALFYCNTLLDLSWIIVLTWKYKMMVHMRPSTIDGLPSAISDGFILTSFIWKKRIQILISRSTQSIIKIPLIKLPQGFIAQKTTINVYKLCKTIV